MRAGVIGLGDMGSGIAKNLIANGFEVTGLALDEVRMTACREMGGKAASSAAEVGANSDAVFVMVMNGGQAKNVICWLRRVDDFGEYQHVMSGQIVLLKFTAKISG